MKMLKDLNTIDSTDVERERLNILALLEARTGDARQKLDFCMEQALTEKTAVRELVVRFLFALQALRLHAQSGVLGKPEVQKLVELGHKLLRLARIKPTTSKLAFLYADLYEALAEIHALEGDRWAQLWDFHKAQLMSRKAARRSRADQLLVTGAGLYRKGNASAAFDLAAEANSGGISITADTEWLRSLYRLRGDFATARQWNSARSAWDDAWTDAMERQDPSSLVEHYRSGRIAKSESHFIDAWLWSRAVPEVQRMTSAGFPSVRQLRRQILGTSRPDEAVFEAANLLENLYDTERPLELRLDDAQEVLRLSEAVVTIERELLCLAALCRWLFRFNQMDLALCVLARYRDLARNATCGHGTDPFGVLTDLSIPKLAGRYRRKQIEPGDEKDFSTARGARLIELGRLAASVSALILKGTLKGWFTDYRTKAEVKIRTESEIATTIVTFLSKRKGALLKLGQICSYVDGPIAGHISEQFAVLQAEVAVMPSDLMRKVFIEALGKPPEQVFATFDETPFAGGSIGQVHRATTHDGREVAVKIRYANVRELIEMEMSTIRMARPLFTRILPLLNWDGLVEEIRKHLISETDYRIELQNIRQFRELFRDDRDVLIPDVLPEFCAESVLTTEYVDGLGVKDFAAVASQSERDAAGEVIARVLLTCNFGRGIYNADPQPGNFIFVPGKVAFIDFGCVKTFSKEFHAARTACNRAFFLNDREGVCRNYLAQGYVDDLEGVDSSYVWRMYETVNAFALKDEPYEVPRDYGVRVYRAFSVENQHKHKFRMAVDSFFSSRIEFGMMAVLSQLRARVNFRRILLANFFPEGDPPAPFAQEDSATDPMRKSV